MARRALRLELSESDIAQLKGWQSAHGTAQQVALRCRLVLAAASGEQDLEIAAAHQVSRHTASLWRRRVHKKGIGAVWEIEEGRGTAGGPSQTGRHHRGDIRNETRRGYTMELPANG